MISGFRFDYDWATFRADLTAGATVAAIAIPQAIAYALLAGVDPKFGLYSATVNTIVAAILGSSSHLINGPTNAISLVVFSALASFQPTSGYEALFLVGIAAGIAQILIGVLRLGDLTRYVSESVILGFMAGAGLLIGVGQVVNFLGTSENGATNTSAVYRAWFAAMHGGNYNWRAITLGAATVALVVALRRVIQKFKLPRVDMLMGLIVFSLLAAWLGWTGPSDPAGKSLVSVVGAVPGALPAFHVPVMIDWDWVPLLARSVVAIALLGALEALAVAKSIASYTRQPLNYNRQIVAEGIGNVIGGFFQALPGSGSLTRSAINYQAGAVTRVSGVYAGVIVAIAVLLFGPYARFIPKSVLAGLLFITAARLVDWRRLFYAVRATWFDAALILLTGLTALLISVEDSILVGVIASIVLFVPRAARLVIRELIVTSERVLRPRLPGEPRDPSLLIFDLEGELFFGAATPLQQHLASMLEEAALIGARFIVLRLRRSRHPDVVAIEQLEQFLRDARGSGIAVLLAGLSPEFVKIMENVGLSRRIEADRVFPEDEREYSATLRAVRHAYALIRASNRPLAQSSDAPESEPPVYYLV